MFSAILPGIFPIVASGLLLPVTGVGLQFASIVALTVSFGLGLSATIHFLNRARLEDNPEADPAVAIERATVLMGPALILTSVVLACGLAVTVFSNLPSLRLFGWLSAFAMIAALVADLLILRPTTMFLRRFGSSPRPGTGLAPRDKWRRRRRHPLCRLTDTALTSVPACGRIVPTGRRHASLSQCWRQSPRRTHRPEYWNCWRGRKCFRTLSALTRYQLPETPPPLDTTSR